MSQGRTVIDWSGREDLNLRPPAPKAGALPGCATPRQKRMKQIFILAECYCFRTSRPEPKRHRPLGLCSPLSTQESRVPVFEKGHFKSGLTFLHFFLDNSPFLC